MRTLLLLLTWYSVGLGVVNVHADRHGKSLDGMPLAVPMLWPAFITAEIYRAVAPPLTNHPEVIPGEAVTSRKD
jgi:hypothetical protein